jgi:hypothetical protein
VAPVVAEIAASAKASAAAAALEPKAPGFVVRLPLARILVMLLIVFHVFSDTAVICRMIYHRYPLSISFFNFLKFRASHA